MKILLISSVIPIPPVTGDRQRTWLLHRALQDLGDVDLVVVKPRAIIDDEAEEGARQSWGLNLFFDTRVTGNILKRTWKKLERVIFPLCEYRINAELNSKLKGMVDSARYDAIVIRYFHTAMIAGVGNLGVPCYLDLDDYEPARFFSETELPDCGVFRRMRLRRMSKKLEGYLNLNISKFAGVWLADQADQKRYGLNAAVHLPNIPFNIQERIVENNSKESDSILVISSRNRGNLLGISQFANGALQALREEFPWLKLRVVGGNLPSQYCQNLAAIPGVILVGRVEDLSVEYERCIMTVAPVAHGAGTSIKVLESFAFGRICVMNEFAARGLDDLDSSMHSKLVSYSIDGMYAIIRDLLSDRRCLAGIADSARKWVTESRSSSAFRKAVALCLREAVESCK